MDMIALVIMSIGALFGLGLLRYVLKNLPTPMGLLIIHGLFMATGFTLLLLFSLSGKGSGKYTYTLILFAITAPLGLWSVWKDMNHKNQYRKITYIHAAMGFTSMLSFYLQVLLE